MGKTWADALPRVSTLTGPPKAVTFVIPFYEAPKFLDTQIAIWRAYPAEIRQHLTAIVVDDGSPIPAKLPTVRPFLIRLFRIGPNIRWNWLAARNIGAHHCATDWMLLTDMDHVVPVETAEQLVFGQHDLKTAYVFSRREHTGAKVHPHSASFFLTRDTFWKTGGYDEMLSGYYGTDGEFRRRLQAVAPFAVLTDSLIRYEFVADASVRSYKRKQVIDQTVQRLIAARPDHWTPRILSFPYAEVTC